MPHSLRDYLNSKPLYEELVEQTKFLNGAFSHIPTRQRMWHLTNSVGEYVLCHTCQKNRVSWTEKTSQYRRFCSSKCAQADASVRKKTEQTCLERFGETTNLKSAEAKATIAATNIERYGVPNPASSDSVKEKIKNTFLRKYGGNPAKNQKVKDKIDATHRARYGRKRASQAHIPDTTIDIKNDRELMLEWHHNNKLPVSRIAEILNVNIAQLCVHFRDNLKIPIIRHNVSLVEQEVREFIGSLNVVVVYGDRTVLSPKELDLYFPDNKVAIELDGLAWHSELRGKGKNYHLDKTMRCAELGIRLIHITDLEWHTKKEIVKSRIAAKLGKTARRIWARKCEIREISSEKHDMFMDDNHIQGRCMSNVRLGLYTENELVAMMSFGKARFSKTAEWELLRYSSLINTTVVGGAGKLFSRFVAIYQPKSIVSYTDLRWNTGEMYGKIGFTFSHRSTPNYWYSKRYKTFEHRIRYQKHKLHAILEKFDDNLSEWENMSANGFDRYWDCGNSVWVWNKSS